MFFKTNDSQIAIFYEKMSSMDEGQAVFEQLTLNELKIWSSTTLKNFNNYSLIMTKIGDNLKIS